MAAASTSPPVNAHAPQALAKSTLLGGVGDLDAAVSLRLHALFLPVPRVLLKALEVAGDSRIWLPVAISLLLISPTTSSKVSPLLVGLVAGLVLDIAFVGLVKLIVRRPRPAYNAADMYVAVAADHWSFPSGHSSLPPSLPPAVSPARHCSSGRPRLRHPGCFLAGTTFSMSSPGLGSACWRPGSAP